MCRGLLARKFPTQRQTVREGHVHAGVLRMKATERQLYTATSLKGEYSGNSGLKPTSSEDKAVLRSSKVTHTLISLKRLIVFDKPVETLHAPAIDIDGIHCELKPSSTEGHYHLYIDKPMPWSDYYKLLTVLYEVGIIEKGFYHASLNDEQTLLRVRHKKYDP